MTKINYAKEPFNRMRREDREVKDEGWIREMLRQAPYGSLATCWDGQPFLHTVLFAYDEKTHVIYLHSAQEGRKRFNIEANPRVCFSISKMGRLLPAKTAMEFGVEYAGVAVFGKAVIVDGEEEASHGLQMLLDKYFSTMKPEEDYRPIQPEELNETCVYRIEIEQWSGKQKVARPDYPGAFHYKEDWS